MPCAPDVENTAMTAQHSQEDSKDEYDMVPEPKTKKGFDIKWQCELRHVDKKPQNDTWWVDYTPIYNTVLEMAFNGEKPLVLLKAHPGCPAGDWSCDLVEFIQTNTETGARRVMRRTVVTQQGNDASTSSAEPPRG
jgi:hypothetical protein